MYTASVSRKTKEGLTISVRNEYLTHDGVVKGIETMTRQVDDYFEGKGEPAPCADQHPNDEHGH